MSQKIKMGVRFPKKTTLFFGEKNQQWEFNSQKRQLYFLVEKTIAILIRPLSNFSKTPKK